jgi:hypothetical protein
MTHVEAIRWQVYMRQRGTLNLGLRLEAGFALLAAKIDWAVGGKSKVTDYLPKREQPQIEVATAQDMFATLTRVAARNERVGRKRNDGYLSGKE